MRHGGLRETTPSGQGKARAAALKACSTAAGAGCALLARFENSCGVLTRMTRKRSGADAPGPLNWPGHPETMAAADIDFEALAHVLANTCRRGGCLRQ